MSVYDVTAIAIDTHPDVEWPVGPARTERIDTETNELFHGCTGPWEVEDQYERFWNRLNDSWEYDFPTAKEKVKVIRVVKVE